MHWALLTLTFLAGALQISPGDGARILAAYPFPSPSHLIVMNALMNELAGRGHELVVITPFPQKKKIPNVTEIDLFAEIKPIKEKMVGKNLFDFQDMKMYEVAFMMWGMGLGSTEAVITSPKLKKVLEDKKGFDLVITESFMNEAMYGLAHHFKV
jgi:glucuronosyltransferase